MVKCAFTDSTINATKPTTQNASRMLDYTTIAEWLRAVSCTSYTYQTVVMNRLIGAPFELPATVVQFKGQIWKQNSSISLKILLNIVSNCYILSTSIRSARKKKTFQVKFILWDTPGFYNKDRSICTQILRDIKDQCQYATNYLFNTYHCNDMKFVITNITIIE